MWHTDKQNKCSEQNTVIGRQCITESHWQVENDMHLLIICSASSTLKAMRSVSGTGTLPLQRDLLGIFVQRQVDRYMTGQRGHGNMARKVVSRKYRLSSFGCVNIRKTKAFFNSQEITSYELKSPPGGMRIPQSRSQLETAPLERERVASDSLFFMTIECLQSSNLLS